MPRKSQFSKEIILQSALEIVDENGINELSINALARKLKIQPPSLYNHLKNLEDLHMQVSVAVHIEITEWIKNAVKRKKSKIAAMAMVESWRDYALTFPGRYKVYTSFQAQDSEEWLKVNIEQRDLITEILQNAYTVSDADIRSAARAIRSFIHGFVMFELGGGWTKIIDIDKSFRKSVELIMKGLELTESEYLKKGRKKIINHHKALIFTAVSFLYNFQYCI